MKVLVACEESQAVTKELRNLGHEAILAISNHAVGGTQNGTYKPM